MFGYKWQKIYLSDSLDKLIKLKPAYDVVFREIDANNIKDICDFRGDEVYRNFLTYQSRGACGVGAWNESGMVAHAWATAATDMPCLAEGYMKLSPREALIHDCHVKGICRGKNVYPALLYFLASRLFLEKNIQSLIIDTESNNLPSLKGISKVGFKYYRDGLFVFFRGNLILSHLFLSS
jgi:hypothetical protein